MGSCFCNSPTANRYSRPFSVYLRQVSALTRRVCATVKRRAVWSSQRFHSSQAEASLINLNCRLIVWNENMQANQPRREKIGHLCCRVIPLGDVSKETTMGKPVSARSSDTPLHTQRLVRADWLSNHVVCVGASFDWFCS